MGQSGEIVELFPFLHGQFQSISPCNHAVMTDRFPFRRTDRSDINADEFGESADREPALSQELVQVVAKGGLGTCRHPDNVAKSISLLQ